MIYTNEEDNATTIYQMFVESFYVNEEPFANGIEF